MIIPQTDKASQPSPMIAKACRNPIDADAVLMTRARDGDDGAFDELMRRYESRVRGFVFKLTGRSSDIEDISQQVFLRAFRARAAYQPSAPFASWLFTISRNVVSNANRSLRRRRESSEWMKVDATLDLIGPSSPDSPFDALNQQEAREAVRAAIDELNDRQRQTLLLIYLQGYSYLDAGIQMGLPVTAIKSLACRARKNLRGILKSRIL